MLHRGAWLKRRRQHNEIYDQVSVATLRQVFSESSSSIRLFINEKEKNPEYLMRTQGLGGTRGVPKKDCRVTFLPHEAPL